MIPNSDTKVMARINKEPNNRGITPYNLYFEQTNTNAICLAPYNPDLKTLFNGIRNMNYFGAITVAFQKDREIFDLIDEIDPVTKQIGSVGFVTQRNGIIKGYSQGGYGILRSLQSKIDLKNKTIVLLGTGNTARSLLVQLMQIDETVSVHLYNRTFQKAEVLANEFPMVKHVGPLQEINSAKGDIFVNASQIGSPWRSGDDVQFSETFVSKFSMVLDVNFVPLETPLIQTAHKLEKITSPGWETFMYGTSMCFENILGIKVDQAKLGKIVYSDFRDNWMQVKPVSGNR